MSDEVKMIVDALNNCSICDSDCIIDAVDLIECLSAENEALRNNLTQRKDCKNCAHSGCGKYRCKLDQTIYGTNYVCRMFVRGDAADLIERLSAELERVSLERDAAVHDLGHEFAKTCYTCIHENEDPCTHQVNGRYTNQCFGWQWRSVCAENSNMNNNYE